MRQRPSTLLHTAKMWLDGSLYLITTCEDLQPTNTHNMVGEWPTWKLTLKVPRPLIANMTPFVNISNFFK